MKKMIYKLVAAVLALILAVVMIVTISYAWMTLSSSPSASGIQVSIGGGNTILIAADKTETVNGVVYHYPDVFRDTLNFSQYAVYDYLDEVDCLSPVSTADGLHWFIPEYYDAFDEEILNGSASIGQVKSIKEFTLDEALAYANQTSSDGDRTKGNYVYLDFWIVSPGEDYKLRVSQGDSHGGSFLMELMNPTGIDSDGDGSSDSYTLSVSGGNAAASARVGFLVNEDQIVDDTMLYYQNSYTYSKLYTKLRGAYAEPGNGMWYSDQYFFTIYEPNGNSHPGMAIDGSYTVTSPISWNGSEAELSNIRDRLCVQLASSWNSENDGNAIPMEQIFQSAIVNRKFDSAEDAKNYFYKDYLQGQLIPYVNVGSFVQYTSNLYDLDGTVTAEDLEQIDTAGATESVYIVSLEKNVPQRIRMFVWLEGQDVDCTDQTSASDFVLNIELAGSNRNVYQQNQIQQGTAQKNDFLLNYLVSDFRSLSLSYGRDSGFKQRLRFFWWI